MDAGTAGVLGAAVGVMGTLATTWLGHHLKTSRETSLADKRRAMLLELLTQEPYKFRSMKTLSASIGASEMTTAELLIELDCRTADDDRTIWGLASRNPRSQ
jgi:hypothetical protein